jgi:hypothetical protein
MIGMQPKALCIPSEGIGRIFRLLHMSDDHGPSAYDPARTYDDAMTLLFAESQGHQCRGIYLLILLVCDQKCSYFQDGVAFARVLEVADDPAFEHIDFPLAFFDYATQLPEEYLIPFFSRQFVSFLRSVFFSADLEIAKNSLWIWANIIRSSEYLSILLLTTDFVSIVLDRSLDSLDAFYIPFMAFLSSAFSRFKIMCTLGADLLDRLHELIARLFDLSHDHSRSVALNCLRTVSASTDREFARVFFTPVMVNLLVRTSLVGAPDVSDDALAVMVNFSSTDECALTMLIDAWFLELSFDPNRMSKAGLCYIADMAANFLGASHATAIQFLESPMMESLVSAMPDACYDVKVRISRGLCLVYQKSGDSDLVEIALGFGPACLKATLDCLDCADMGFKIFVIWAIGSLLEFAATNPRVEMAVEAADFLEMKLEEGLLDAIVDMDDLPSKVALEVEEIRRLVLARVHSVMCDGEVGVELTAT